MLVLSRKVGERIVIADNIQVVVCGIQGDRVKLGFSAPEHIRIVRKELTEKPARTVQVSRGQREGSGVAKAVDHGVPFTVS